MFCFMQDKLETFTQIELGNDYREHGNLVLQKNQSLDNNVIFTYLYLDVLRIKDVLYNF